MTRSFKWRGRTAGAMTTLALIVGAPSIASAATAPTETEGAEIALSAPIEDLSDVTSIDGKRLRVIDDDLTAEDEKTAVVVDDDGNPVVIRSLYSQPEEAPVSDASEPGLADGWVEGETYFTDGKAQTDEQVVSFDDLPGIEPEELQLNLTTATSAASFSAAWAQDRNVPYTVLRDGVAVTRTSDGAFIDSGLESGKTYTYTVRPSEGQNQGEELTFQAQTLPSDAAAVAAETSNAVQAFALQPTASWFVYNTFITNDKVDWDIMQGIGGGCVGTFGDRFGGDNRGYRTPPLYNDPWQGISHRTGARMKVDFGPNVVIENKDVGQTKLYTSTGKVKETRTASTAGIKFSERSVSSKLYSVKLSHEVGNPFCSVGAIRYTVYVKIWASGVMQVNGLRHPVPQHEAYGLFMNSSGTQAWVSMYKGAQGDFKCVSGLCPTQSISKTHTPS